MLSGMVPDKEFVSSSRISEREGRSGKYQVRAWA